MTKSFSGCSPAAETPRDTRPQDGKTQRSLQDFEFLWSLSLQATLGIISLSPLAEVDLAQPCSLSSQPTERREGRAAVWLLPCALQSLALAMTALFSQVNIGSLPKYLSIYEFKVTTSKLGKIFINHILLHNTFHLSGLLSPKCVSLDYRNSFKPQWIPTNQGFQQTKVLKGVGVSSKHTTFEPRVEDCPES